MIRVIEVYGAMLRLFFQSVCKILVVLVYKLRETERIGLQSKTTCKVGRF